MYLSIKAWTHFSGLNSERRPTSFYGQRSGIKNSVLVFALSNLNKVFTVALNHCKK